MYPGVRASIKRFASPFGRPDLKVALPSASGQDAKFMTVLLIVWTNTALEQIFAHVPGKLLVGPWACRSPSAVCANNRLDRTSACVL